MRKHKTVLTEGQIRRWMELSGNKKLTDSFLKKLNESVEEESVVEEGVFENSDGDVLRVTEEEEPEEEREEGEEGAMGAESPAPEMPPTEEPEMAPDGDEAPGAGGDEGMVKQLVDAIASAIQGVSGVQVTVDGAGVAGEEMPSMGDESEAPMPPAGGDEMPPVEEPAPEGLPGEEKPEEIDEMVPPIREGVPPGPPPGAWNPKAKAPVHPEPEIKESKVINTKPESFTDEKKAPKDAKYKETQMPKDLNKKASKPSVPGDMKTSETQMPKTLDEKLVKEVAKRVAARLIKEIKKTK